MSNSKILLSFIVFLGISSPGMGIEDGITPSGEETTIFNISSSSEEEESVAKADFMETTTTIAGFTTTVSGESDLLYLEYEFGNIDREVFWNKNHYECKDGKLVPSKYLQEKYYQCEQIHTRHQNPNCIKNCEMAITLLLGPTGIPSMKLFNRYFDIVLPTNSSSFARKHVADCFDKFGSDDLLLDQQCEKPQPFFACLDDMLSKLIC